MKTKVFTVTPEQVRRGDTGDVREAADILRKGGLLALPTETVYGLGANGLDEEAVRRIFEAKGRPQDNPLILHVADETWLPRYCSSVPEVAYRLAREFWPGPLTMILPRKPLVPDCTTGGLETVGMRCPAHEVTLAVIREADVPVAAPSANLSGRPSCTTAEHVLRDMDGKIEGVIDGGACAVGVESTILDLTVTPPRLLRPGGLPLEALRRVVGEVALDKATVEKLGEGERPKAPGMKYRHYAPKAPVTVFTGDAKKTARAIRRRAGKTSGVLCFSEFAETFPNACSVVPFGKSDDTAEQARLVFDALRRFDDTGAEEIFAQCPDAKGLGFAVANRLKKAAGFHTVALPGAGRTVIGFAGATGAGKTSALRAVRELGGLALDCDAVYREMQREDETMRAAFTATFGAEIYKDGELDRPALAARVFSSETELGKLNEIVFDLLPKEVLRRIENSDATLIGIDAVNLLDCTLRDFCDLTVAVTAPEEVRLARIMKRDGLSKEAAMARIRAQRPQEYYVNLCDESVVSDAADSAEATERMRRRIEEYLKK